MKHVLLLLLIVCTFTARANDTLTRAQIYNFNVGDTFDYEENVTQLEGCPGPCVTSLQLNNYFRCIIHQTYYSSDSDTLFVVRNWIYPLPEKFDTLVLDSLQYEELLIDTSHGQPQQFFIDTNSKYNHGVLNVGTFDGGFLNYSNGYVEGLGKVFTYNASGEGGGFDSIYLIYYSKNAETWGIPYYVADQSYLVQFIPIPEECAAWVSSTPPPCGNYVQVVRTGNRISANSHTYVEMIYSGYDIVGDSLITPDSLIGYFRNDTANLKVYLYSNFNSFPFLIYDFSTPADSFILNLNQLEVGGQLRTVWSTGNSAEFTEGAPISYIEGVGSLAGIYPFSCYSSGDPLENYPPFWAYSTLNCFSVCGQTLYADSGYYAMDFCSLATINNINSPAPAIKLYPNPNNGQFNVEVTNQNLQNLQLVVTDITGQEIKRCLLNKQLNNVSIELCASGMYIWQVWSGGRLVQSGKLVKE